MAIVDLAFGLQGWSLPCDHGYPLFAAVSRVVGRDTHAVDGFGIHRVRGAMASAGKLQLTPVTRLLIRTGVEGIPRFLPLAGKRLDVDAHQVRVGVPSLQGLVPTATLYSPMVTLKGFTEEQSFLQAVRRRLTGDRSEPPVYELGLSEDVEAVIPFRKAGPRVGEPLRRVMRIKDKTIVGFALLVSGLTPEESLILQERGLGGRRHMGCGVFTPAPSSVTRMPAE